MSSSHFSLRNTIWLLIGLTLLFVIVWRAPAFYAIQGLASYLPLHMFAESFSIVVSMMVFGIVWNVHSKERQDNFVILACALLAVGLIDFAHMLSFKGMPDFITPSGPEKAINLWLSARLIAALALLVVSIHSWHPSHNPRIRYYLLAISLVVAAAVIWPGLANPQAWPHTFIEGIGLTPFKIGAEYAIIAILLVPAIRFYRQSGRRQSYDATSMFAATVITILSELSFTLYSDVADIFNLLGHLYKIVAYAFIYRAVFMGSVHEPFHRLDAELAENTRITKQLQDSASERTQLAAIVEFSNDAIIGKTLDGVITSWNKGAEKIYGYSAAEIIGKRITTLVPAALQAETEGFLATVRNGGVIANHETQRLRKDGSTIHVALTLSPFSDAVGNISGISTIARDITERKQAEDALFRLTLLQRTILDHVGYGIISTNPEGIVTSFNSAAERLLGYTAGEVIGKQTSALWHDPEEIARHATQLSEQLGETVAPGFDVFTARPRHNLPEEDEWTFIRKDGGRIPVNLSVTALRDEGGQIMGFVGLAYDLSERKQAETERLTNLHFFESMDRVNRAIQGAHDLDQMMNDVLTTVLSIFDCDRTWLFYPCDPDSPTFRVPMEISKPEYPGAGIMKNDVPMPPDMIQNLREALESADPVTYAVGTETPINKLSAEQFGVKSMILAALYPKTGMPWAFGLHQCSHPRIWLQEEVRLFREIGRRLADGLSSLLSHRELQESEAKYRRIVDTATEGIWGFGPDMMTTFINARMAGMLGYSSEEMMGRLFTEFMFEEDMPDHLEKMQKRYQGQSETYERRFRRKDNQTVWTLVSATPVFDDQHSIQGSFGMFTDITERKRVEDALLFVAQRGWQASAENFFDALAQFLGEELDMEYVLIDRLEENPEMAETVALYSKGAIAPNMRYALKGTPCENVMGKQLCIYRHGVQQLFPEDALLPGMGAESYIGIPLWDSTGRPIGLIAIMGTKPIPDEAPVTQLLQLVATRVAAEMERKRAEEEIRKLNQQLEHRVADRTSQLEAANKELESFSYSVSHDLRTPLRAIDGFSHILLEDYAGKLDDEGKRLLNVVRDNTNRMGQLIDDILNFSRTGRVELTSSTIDMEQMARGVFEELLSSGIGSKAQLKLDAIPSALGDNAMMRQVFVNLLSNAIKFSRNNKKPAIQVGATVKDGETLYYVKDNGVGFDMQYADKLFGVFQRLHSINEFEGTGIGLAIVKRIITRHGGRVWAEGKVNEGATVYFALPAGEKS